MPCETEAASPAVSRTQCSEPTCPELWHEAQFCSRIGATAALNDGPPAMVLACGPVMVLGMAYWLGSSAVRFNVSATSSPVDTRPCSVIGPMPNVESLMLVVALTVSLPLSTEAVACQVTGAVLLCTVAVPTRVSGYDWPSTSFAGRPSMLVTWKVASGWSWDSRKSWRMRASRRLLSEWSCSRLTTIVPTLLFAGVVGSIRMSPAMPLVRPVAWEVAAPIRCSEIL